MVLIYSTNLQLNFIFLVFQNTLLFVYFSLNLKMDLINKDENRFTLIKTLYVYLYKIINKFRLTIQKYTTKKGSPFFELPLHL